MSYCWSEIITQQCYGRLGALYSRISGELPVFLIPPSLQTTSLRATIRHEMALVLWISHHVSTPLCVQHDKQSIKTDEDLHGDLLQLFCFVALSHWAKWTAKRFYPARLFTSFFLLVGMGVTNIYRDPRQSLPVSLATLSLNHVAM